MNAPGLRHTILLGLGLAGIVVSGNAAAGLYKWVDDQGNVTYSQVAPPDREVQRITPPPPPPEQPAPSKEVTQGDSNADQSAAEKARREKAERLAKEDERIKKENCEIAKRNLEAYRNHRRFRNEAGEVMVMDDKTRAAKIKETEKQIKESCS